MASSNQRNDPTKVQIIVALISAAAVIVAALITTRPNNTGSKQQTYPLTDDVNSSAPPTTAPILSLTTAPPKPLMLDNFNDDDAQRWTVMEQGSAKIFDGKYIVIGEPVVMTLTGSETWQNYSFRIKAKVVSGTDGFGVLVRANEKLCNLYMLQFIDNVVRLVRYDGGNCTNHESISYMILESSSYKIERDTWYHIRVDVQGTTITGYVNEVQVISVDDALYLQGKIGLRAAETQIFFDDLEVVPLSNP